jgi:hypothetical protein
VLGGERVLVHEAIAPALLERLAGAVDVLQVGQAQTFGIQVPPSSRPTPRPACAATPSRPRAAGAWRRAARRAPTGRAGSARPPSPRTCPPTRPCCARRSSGRCSPWRPSGTSRTPATASTPCPSP